MDSNEVERQGVTLADKPTGLAQGKPKRKPTPLGALLAIDALLIAVAFGIFALFHNVLPQAYALVDPSVAVEPSGMAESGAEVEPTATVTSLGLVAAASAAEAEQAQTSDAEPASAENASETQSASDTQSLTETPSASETASVSEAESTSTPESATEMPDGAATAESSAAASDLGGGKFTDKFTTGEVISTGNSYTSKNVNVTVSQVQKDGVTYYVQDIYIRNIENLRAGFANGTYGRAIVDWVVNMAQDYNAIAAINGDYYGAGSVGVVIRNGTLYSDRVDASVLVLFYDGAMKVYAANEFDADAVMAAGAYQAWSFGPSLLDENGQAYSGFTGGISGANPRTAIGYYEPGHYVFVVVDGRQPGYSVGVTLDQLAELMQELGVKVAYNLDGGKTSQMTFGDSLANQPYHDGRTTSDIIYIGETE